MMNEIQLKQKIIQKLEAMGWERLAFLNSFIDGLDAYVRFQRASTADTFDADTFNTSKSESGERQTFVSSLKGKYAQVATSSDEFAGQKQAEINLEKRHG